jgi:2C-methyl-D-erythritol 2,4-cyclodiphosphate synthase
MAIYHFTIKIISRGKGKSAVAAAAYRSASKFRNEYDNRVSDYTSKPGVVHTEILLPPHAPQAYLDRERLWNAVERVEAQKNSQLAREIEFALPNELTQEQNISLARSFVQAQFVDEGMCADMCLHDKGDGNPHVHLMLTLRPINVDGTWGQKARKVNGMKVPTTNWNEHSNAEKWRSAWANAVNSALEENDITERIDHRSYERQGVKKVPSIHMGVAAMQMEKRGIETERGNINRTIEVTNKQLAQLQARMKRLQAWLEETPPAPVPELWRVLDEIFSGENRSNYQIIRDIKQGAHLLSFLQTNNIRDIEGCNRKLKDMIGQRVALRNELKKKERRLTTLDKYIKQADIYFKFKDKKRLSEAEYFTNLSPPARI